jgi:hypothetical protein
VLELRPKAWYSWDFRVLDGETEIAYLDRHWLRERASFTLDGAAYEVRRTSTKRGTFVLERDGHPIAEAEKPSAWFRTLEIRAGPEHWVLKPASALRREFRLLRGGLDLGSIYPTSVLGRTTIVELSDQVPRPLQVFLACLVQILWKRSADRAAAGS